MEKKQLTQSYIELVKSFKSYSNVKPPIIDYLLAMPVGDITKIEILHRMIFFDENEKLTDSIFELAGANLKPEILCELSKLYGMLDVLTAHEPCKIAA